LEYDSIMNCNSILKFDFATNEWNEVRPKGKIVPSRRGKHFAFVKEKSMFVYGGESSMYKSWQDIQRFDFETSEWCEVQYYGTAPLVTLHCASYYNDGIEDSLFIFGGNDIHKFDFHTNSWSIMKTPGTTPLGSYGANMAVYERCLYIFGGHDGQTYSNELYKFEIDQCRFIKLEIKACPIGRGQSSMIVKQNNLWTTGGHFSNDGLQLSYLNDLWTFPFGYSILE